MTATETNDGELGLRAAAVASVVVGGGRNRKGGGGRGIMGEEQWARVGGSS